MKRELESAVAASVQALFGVETKVELTRPEEQFGDFATNVALQLSKQLQKNPREIADILAAKLRDDLIDQVSEITVAGPGFINLKLTDQTLVNTMQAEPDKSLDGKIVVAEYSDPNPFKVLHAGHLYTSVVGDAIANLLQNAGATVHRVNFGGDVGLHVAKTMWAILHKLGGENPERLGEGILDLGDIESCAKWLGECYIDGTNIYEEDDQAKTEIIALNKRIYQIHSEDDHDSPFAQIYWTCRKWSYDYFDFFYRQIQVKPFKYYPESLTAPIGLSTVRNHIGDVYEESQGAIIFDGEKYGLHTRVFINSEGLPTYETKDVGLIMKKWEDFHFDRSLVITGNDIVEYMKVVLKSIEQFQPELSDRTTHLTHGLVKLAGGEKMSSRKGNILGALDIISTTGVLVPESEHGIEAKKLIVYGAIKYAFLKNRTGGDIIYDPTESVSLEGNSGPYLQYAHARARSILSKVGEHSDGVLKLVQDDKLQAGERSLVRKIGEYPEAVEKATAELMPHHICTYLYELAQEFNRFYEHNRVIEDERQALRLQLVEHYAKTLKAGLELLGIAAPDKM